MEKWKTIKRHPKYEVSDMGRVRRIETKRVRKPVKIKNGYMTIMFYDNGVYVLEYVHRLVADAFLKNELCMPVINHKDKNRENNCAENLEWCDTKYNVQYSLSIPVVQKTTDGRIVKRHNGVREAERIIGVPHGSIDRCARGEYKTAYGYVWEYVY